MVYKIRLFFKVVCIFFFERFPCFISDESHAKLLYFIMFGEKLDIRNPKTLNQYICSSKISDNKLNYSIYTDKYKVREYVKVVVGDWILNTVIGVYDSFDEIDFSYLPTKFVLKATHGSSYNMIVTNKDRFDKTKAKKKFDKWLLENYYFKDREKNYKNINPRIICDSYLEPADGQLEEYKLFCFNGKVGFIQHNKQMNQKRFSNIFDSQWNLLPVKYGYSGFRGDYKPQNGEELIEVAEKLSAIFEFVRVDLYNVDGRIVFSELTFHSGGGLIPFLPNKFDREFGQKLGL